MSKHAKSQQAPTHEEIAICAQAIYEREGRPQGRAMEHWLAAEKQLNAERKGGATESAGKQQPSGKMRGNDWQTSSRQNLHTN
jgi:hypothetical protein